MLKKRDSRPEIPRARVTLKDRVTIKARVILRDIILRAIILQGKAPLIHQVIILQALVKAIPLDIIHLGQVQLIHQVIILPVQVRVTLKGRVILRDIILLDIILRVEAPLIHQVIILPVQVKEIPLDIIHQV
ncbi:MAG: hypothetical protein V1893_01630 [Candidatus Omnitrophota bacterium]